MKTELLLTGIILGILGIVIGLAGISSFPVNAGAMIVGIMMFIIAIPLFFIGLLTTAATEILDHNKPFQTQQMSQQQVMIMICPKCRNRIATDADFCPKCGTDLRPIPQ
jgi:ribosomal protein L40E